METMRPRPGCDSISTLPDDVLVAILSLLPMKEAARTSLLSSRWKNVWRYLPRLNFAVDKSSLRTPRRLQYIRLVNAVLRSHKAPVLEEFRVCFDLTSDATEDLNNWLEYALSKQVQRLYFDLSGYYEKVYAFPEEILHRQTSRVGFNSLRSLSLIRVNVRSEVITHVLENSPFLERLVVHGSKSISELEVCGSDIKLKSLEVCHCSYLVLLKVCAPNLTKLKVTKLDGLLLDDVPKLTEVSIPLNFYKHDSYKTVYKYAISSVYKIAFISLSCCISQLESLALRSSRALKIMDHRVLPELSNLKKLTLVMDALGNDSLLGLMSLIRASPKLEEFVLQLLWHRPHRSNRQVKMDTKSPHHCLKLVEFIGYNGRTSDCELVKSLIENCTALEKVIICPRPHYEPFKSKGLIEEEEIARGHAKQKLEGQVPDHIKLILL